MQRVVRRIVWGCALVMAADAAVSPAFAEVRSIAGRVTATVAEMGGSAAGPSDFAADSFPGATPAPPAVARARLDRILTGDATASGQSIAILNDPRQSGSPVPNDVGIDVSAFSADPDLRYHAEGNAVELRRIVMTPADVGAVFAAGSTVRIRSRIILSGAMIITALHPGMDLSGTEVAFQLSVTQHRPDMAAVTLISGEVELRGTAAGGVEVAPTGLFMATPPFVVDFGAQLPTLPMSRAAIFTGFQIPYEYDAVVGEEFTLELIVGAEADTIPGGVGAAAVFGIPIEGLGTVFERVMKDDRGFQLAARVSDRVDTTGQAYRTDGATIAPFAPLFSLCGWFGVEAIGLVAAFAAVAGARRRRRFARPPSTSGD